MKHLSEFDPQQVERMKSVVAFVGVLLVHGWWAVPLFLLLAAFPIAIILTLFGIEL